MNQSEGITIAAKCAPEARFFSDIKRAGLGAVELYFSRVFLKDVNNIINVCRDFPFRYALHAPADGLMVKELKDLAEALKAEVVVFHNVYWEDEWKEIVELFNNSRSKLCIENTYSGHEPVKFIKRYGLGRCLDLEHLQLECIGVFEEVFISILKETSHVHLTGYVCGTKNWHTHIHHSPRHNTYMLNLIKNAGYKGLVVSEAKESLQTYEEFKRLQDFFLKWKSKNS